MSKKTDEEMLRINHDQRELVEKTLHMIEVSKKHISQLRQGVIAQEKTSAEQREELMKLQDDLAMKHD